MSCAFVTVLVIFAVFACSEAAPSSGVEKRNFPDVGKSLLDTIPQKIDVLNILKQVIEEAQKMIREMCPEAGHGGSKGKGDHGPGDYYPPGDYRPSVDYYPSGDYRPSSDYVPPRQYRNYVPAGDYKSGGDYKADGHHGKENLVCYILKPLYKVLEDIKKLFGGHHDKFDGKHGSGKYYDDKSY